MYMSLSDCRNACAADSICLAFTHNSVWNTCSQHDSTETISFECPDCTYYLKFCAPTTSMFTFLCHIIFQQLLFCVVDSFRPTKWVILWHNLSFVFSNIWYRWNNQYSCTRILHLLVPRNQYKRFHSLPIYIRVFLGLSVQMSARHAM